jgi:hypothetical protein
VRSFIASHDEPPVGIERQPVRPDQQDRDAAGHGLRTHLRDVGAGEAALLEEDRQGLALLPLVDDVAGVLAE